MKTSFNRRSILILMVLLSRILLGCQEKNVPVNTLSKY